MLKGIVIRASSHERDIRSQSQSIYRFTLSSPHPSSSRLCCPSPKTSLYRLARPQVTAIRIIALLLSWEWTAQVSSLKDTSRACVGASNAT